MNRFDPHLLILPEDDANRQIVNGFIAHPNIDSTRIKLLRPAGGWTKAVRSLTQNHCPEMNIFIHRIFVLIIDFDGIDSRCAEIRSQISEPLGKRIFVLGARTTPEDVKRSATYLSSYEKIGRALAEDCIGDKRSIWGKHELNCNLEEIQRLRENAGPWLFR